MNLNLMKRIAMHSDHKSYKHVALIFSGGRLLSYGYNTNTMHAEVSALKRLDRIYRTYNSRRPRNLHLVSFMLRKKTGNIGSSSPCDSCWDAIVGAKVRTVTYYNHSSGGWINTWV